MTIYDLRCDRCGLGLIGPAGPAGAADTTGADSATGIGSAAGGPGAARLGVRFRYNPGDPRLGDDAGLVCGPCWLAMTAAWSPPGATTCRVCDEDLTGRPCLFVWRFGELLSWQLCRRHAVRFLNELRTVEPKLDERTFVLPT